MGIQGIQPIRFNESGHMNQARIGNPHMGDQGIQPIVIFDESGHMNQARIGSPHMGIQSHSTELRFKPITFESHDTFYRAAE
jgi:hypothetical protein